MTEVTYKQCWIELFEKDRNDLMTVVDWDLFKDWALKSIPVGVISNELRMGLDVLYSGHDPDLGRRFLERARALIERTEADGKLEGERGQVGFFMHRADFLLNKGLTLGLLEGVTCREPFRQAANDFLAWLFQEKDQPIAWHEQDRARFLAAVSSRLICGDVAEAHALFDRAPTTGWIHPEARLYRDLCAEWHPAGHLSRPLKSMLWHCFDTVRSPDYRPDFFVRLPEFRLEFGAIVWKYVLENQGEINWQEVIECVSR